MQIPTSGDLLCIWNQASEQEIRTGFYRSRLTSAISKNRGGTWEHFRTVVMSDGMKKVDRIVDPNPPGHLRPSGAVPDDVNLIPPEGFRSVRAPRVSIIGKSVYLCFDDRLYGRSPHDDHGWVRIRVGYTLRVIPIPWFYEKDM